MYYHSMHKNDGIFDNIIYASMRGGLSGAEVSQIYLRSAQFPSQTLPCYKLDSLLPNRVIYLYSIVNVSTRSARCSVKWDSSS